MNKTKKIILIRGKNLNPWDMQMFEPLQDEFDIQAIEHPRSRFETNFISSPIIKLNDFKYFIVNPLSILPKNKKRYFYINQLGKLLKDANIVMYIFVLGLVCFLDSGTTALLIKWDYIQE